MQRHLMPTLRGDARRLQTRDSATNNHDLARFGGGGEAVATTRVLAPS